MRERKKERERVARVLGFEWQVYSAIRTYCGETYVRARREEFLMGSFVRLKAISRISSGLRQRESERDNAIKIPVSTTFARSVRTFNSHSNKLAITAA